MTERCCDSETSPNHHPSKLCFTVGMRHWCWCAAFDFGQMSCYTLWVNIFTFFSSVQRYCFQKSCGLFRWNFPNLSHPVMFFLEMRGTPHYRGSRAQSPPDLFHTAAVKNASRNHSNCSVHNSTTATLFVRAHFSIVTHSCLIPFWCVLDL